MRVRLKDGSVVDIQRMSVTERSMVINDLSAQIKEIEAKFQAIHVDEVMQITMLREKIAKSKESLKKNLSNLKRIRNDAIALNKDIHRKRGEEEDRILLDVIKEIVSHDDFMRFVEIAKQRMKTGTPTHDTDN